MAEMKVTLCGIEMDNPIIPASGTFGYGYEFAELYDINFWDRFPSREPRWSLASAIRRPASRSAPQA